MARPRKSATENQCIVCGTFFPVAFNQTKRKTCSQECLKENVKARRTGKHFPGKGGRARVSKSEETCVICSKTFPLTTTEAAGGKKTCSDQCRNAYYSQVSGGLGEGICEGCGKHYKVSRYFLRNGRRFCGDACRLQWFSQQALTGEESPYWRGGTWAGYYGASWQSARRSARERDNHQCIECGKHRDELGYEPIVHHKVPFKHFGVERHIEANNLDNLCCYCRSCHLKIEWRLHRRKKIVAPAP